jgi:nitrite reductase/ring-hydroxylating ferredoxin subunit
MSHGDTRPFAYQRQQVVKPGFLLRYTGQWFAYANICPHWNVDLDLGDNRFFDERRQAIVCRNHGALFQPETGQCRAGPCLGAYLERFEVTLDGADALVSVPILEIFWG